MSLAIKSHQIVLKWNRVWEQWRLFPFLSYTYRASRWANDGHGQLVLQPVTVIQPVAVQPVAVQPVAVQPVIVHDGAQPMYHNIDKQIAYF